LLEHLTEYAVGQVVGGGDDSPYFSARQHGGAATQEPRHEHGPPGPAEPTSACARPDVSDLPC